MTNKKTKGKNCSITLGWAVASPICAKKIKRSMDRAPFYLISLIKISFESLAKFHKTIFLKQLSLQFNLSEIAIRKLISAYNKEGEAVFDVKGQGGRKNEILTFEEEVLFLKQFFDRAIKGQIATAEEIRKAFVKQTGRKKVAKSTIYDLLKRHGWSKKKARPSHPKSDKEAQATFKKTFRKKLKK